MLVTLHFLRVIIMLMNYVSTHYNKVIQWHYGFTLGLLFNTVNMEWTTCNGSKSLSQLAIPFLCEVSKFSGCV